MCLACLRRCKEAHVVARGRKGNSRRRRGQTGVGQSRQGHMGCRQDLGFYSKVEVMDGSKQNHRFRLTEQQEPV